MQSREMFVFLLSDLALLFYDIHKNARFEIKSNDQIQI